jgi:hypothetical protein
VIVSEIVGRAVLRALTLSVGEMERVIVAGILPIVSEIVGEAIRLIDAGSAS